METYHITRDGVSVAEARPLHQGVAMAKNALVRAARTEKLGAATASSRGLPLFTRNADDLAGLDDLVTVIAV